MTKSASRDPAAGSLHRRDFLRLLGLALGVPVLVACTTQRKDSRLFVVKIGMDQGTAQFSPGVVKVPTGSTVTWQNISIYPQSVTCDPSQADNPSMARLPAGAKSWDSGVLYPGQTWSYTFTEPGNYLYFSRYQANSSPSGVVSVS